jgi:N-acetyltransferase 10
MGYGSRSIQALNSFYSGELLNLDEVAAELEVETFADAAKVSSSASLSTDRIGIRDAAKMPPLLQRLSERQPENLDYLGVSYGVTPALFRFWKRAGFVPLYIRQTQNELTGEHSCVMLRGLNKNMEETSQWLGDFAVGASCSFFPSPSQRSFPSFSQTSASALSSFFRSSSASLRPRPLSASSTLPAALTPLFNDEVSTSLSSLSSPPQEAHTMSPTALVASEVREFFSPFDLKRLQSYAVYGQIDWHAVIDLLPTVAALYFAKRFPEEVNPSPVQSSVLCAMGLQRKSENEIAVRFLFLPFAVLHRTSS